MNPFKQRLSYKTIFPRVTTNPPKSIYTQDVGEVEDYSEEQLRVALFDFRRSCYVTNIGKSGDVDIRYEEFTFSCPLLHVCAPNNL